MKWYRTGMVGAILSSQVRVAETYYTLGRAAAAGVKQDYAEAAKWYRRAADAGYANAQNMLASMLTNALGVPKDLAEAAKWKRKAAEQGDFSGLYGLGYVYSKGEGVPQDLVQSYLFYDLASKAATDKNTIADAISRRDSVGSAMTSGQIAEAQKMARDWKPTGTPWL